LQFLDQQPLYKLLDLSAAAPTQANAANLSVELSIFKCPSTPNVRLEHIAGFNNAANLPPYNDIGPAARSDYDAVAGLHRLPPGTTGSNYDTTPVLKGAWGIPEYDAIREVRIRLVDARLRDIADGLSNTILIGEKAGRPNWYLDGKLLDLPSFPQIPGPGDNEAAWGISSKIWAMIPSQDDKINEQNSSGFFSFHNGIANFAYADGATKSISESVDQSVLNAVITRSNHDSGTTD